MGCGRMQILTVLKSSPLMLVLAKLSNVESLPGLLFFRRGRVGERGDTDWISSLQLATSPPSLFLSPPPDFSAALTSYLDYLSLPPAS